MERGDVGSRMSSAKAALVSKLLECGSVELMANLAMLESYKESALFHNSADPIRENPYLAYVLGMFLSHNNAGCGEPDPKKLREVVALAKEYFDLHAVAMTNPGKREKDDDDFLTYLSRLKKIHDDLNPHKYLVQQRDYLDRVLRPFDYYFASKYGFSASDAAEFSAGLAEKIKKAVSGRLDRVLLAARQIESKFSQPESKPLLDAYESSGMTKGRAIGMYAEFLMCRESKDAFIINVDEHCREQKISKVREFRKFMDAFSCRLGGQIPGFDDPLSGNVIFSKPLIKLDAETFFIPKVDLLHMRLDVLLERLLEAAAERGRDMMLDKFSAAKSRYLEGRAHSFFARMFPQNCLHKNALYVHNGKPMEIDLLVVYDNKILVVEAKSGGVPLAAKRGGGAKMKSRLRRILRKAVEQTDSAIDYLESCGTARFYRKGGSEPVVEVDMSGTEYEFYSINVTYEHLGTLSFVPRSVVFPDRARNEKRFWSVYIHDLDIIADLLAEPVFFIHYMESRAKVNYENSVVSDELDALGYYLQHGILPPNPGARSQVTLVGHVGHIDAHYVYNAPKPRLQIPGGLKRLLLNMQKRRQAGFTKISSAALDFPKKYKVAMGSKLGEIFEEVSRGKKPSGFVVPCKEIDTGFSYLPSSNMADLRSGKSGFYARVMDHHAHVVGHHGVRRSAVIVGDSSDKENHAAFFSYYQQPS